MSPTSEHIIYFDKQETLIIQCPIFCFENWHASAIFNNKGINVIIAIANINILNP